MEITDKIIQEEIDQYYMLETVEQLQALSDPIRNQIILLLRQQAMTGAQIARAMDLSRPRAHYFLKSLVELKLVHFRGERVDNGLVGKYYRAIASYFSYDRLAKKMKQMDPSDPEAVRIFKAIMDFASNMAATTQSEFQLNKELTGAFFSTYETNFTVTQYEQIMDEIQNLVDHLIAIQRENSIRNNKDANLAYRTTIFLNPIPVIPIIKQ